jgi:hypothetical protein
MKSNNNPKPTISLCSLRIVGVEILVATLVLSSYVSASASISQEHSGNHSHTLYTSSQRLLTQNTEITETPFGCVSLTSTIDSSDRVSSSDSDGNPEGVPGGMRYEAYKYQVPPGSLLAFEISSQDFQPVIALRITGRYIENLGVQQNQTGLSVLNPSELRIVRATDSSRILNIGAIIPRSRYAELPLPGGGRESAEYELIIGSSGSGNYFARGGVVQLESPPQPSESEYVIGLNDNQTSTALEVICQDGQ